MKEQEVLQYLSNPENEKRAKPFWCWNGDLEEQELYRQIDIIKEMGFGGFFMHSRTGLITEYMGEKWFDLTRKCAEYAQKVGLEAWLYDEDRWPSGTCGGAVTVNPEYRLRFISEYDSDEEATACKEVVGILARYAVRTDAEDKLIDCYPVESKEEVKNGYRYCVYAEEMMCPSDFYNGYTYVDTMNKKAVERFLELTHEQYKKHCGDLLGTLIQGIFTDEPHRGATFIGFGISNKNYKRMISYTAAMPAAYEQKYGEKFIIPQIYYTKQGSDFNEAAYRYLDIADDLFIGSYAIPYREWCKKNGMIATGHILHEDNLSIQTSLSGSMMRYYAEMEYPGIDHLTEENYAYWIAKQCSSVAHQLGKPYVLSELYGCTGWQMTLNRYKKIGDWQALFGVSLRCPHLSWYTMKGEAKRDYPASIFYQSAWYKDWKILEDYYARVTKIMTNGTQRVDTLVLHPVESMWGLVHKNWMDGFSPKDQTITDLERAFVKQFHELTASHVDFDYGDEEIMSKHGSVVVEHGIAYLQIGQVKYKEVLVQNITHHRESTEKLLSEFAAKGGKIVTEVAKLNPSIRFNAQTEVAVTVRELQGDVWAFFCNLDEKNAVGAYQIEVPSEYKNLYAEEWDLTRNKNLGATDLHFAFEAGQMRIVRLTSEPPKSVAKKSLPKLELPEQMDYKLTEPNVLVLDRASWSLNGELQENGKPKDVLKIDRAVRDRFGLTYRGGEMVQPWFAKKYSPSADEKLGDVQVCYVFDSQVEMQVRLACEESQSIVFNGTEITERAEEFWVDPCFRVYNLGALKKGKNEIVIGYAFRPSTNIEGIYLLGEFGVQLPCTVTELPKQLTAGDITTQGLPFYGAAIEYHTGIHSGKYTVQLNTPGATCVHIKGGKKEDFLAFAPYTADAEVEQELVLEAVFTRRNTFGPFHLRPYPQGGYGPDSFVTEGENWSDEYCIEPQGLELSK